MPKKKTFVVRLTEEEINVLLGACRNVDSFAMAEDTGSEELSEEWIAVFDSACEKLKNAKK